MTYIKTKPETSPCLTCNGPVLQSMGRGRLKRYCSRACSNQAAYVKAVNKINCPTCGEEKEDSAGRLCFKCAKNRSTQDWKLRRLRLYNLRTLVLSPDYRCPICQDPVSLEKGQIDHDHSCCNREGSCGLCVRGVLCAKCNNFIERVKEDTVLLRRAADYLEFHKTKLNLAKKKLEDAEITE